MNLKRIWMVSIILGTMVAALAYITVFAKEPGNISAEQKVKAAKEEKKPEESAIKPEKEVGEREISNPLQEITKGKRAISLKINLEQGVSGYIEPGSKVDVIAYETTKDEKTKKEYKSAVLVLENVKVLTSGKSADNPQEALHYETVTVEVTPEEGVMLGLASKDKDGFYLLLRNEGDAITGKAGLKQTREVIKEEEKEKK